MSPTGCSDEGIHREPIGAPPDCSVDLRSTFGGRRPPLQPHGGVIPPPRCLTAPTLSTVLNIPQAIQVNIVIADMAEGGIHQKQCLRQAACYNPLPVGSLGT